EESGNALDAHGANELTDNNSVGSAAGKIGTARSFAASIQYLSAASNASLQTGDIDFTFAVWVWMASTAARTIAGKWGGVSNPGGGREWRLQYFSPGSRYRFEVSSDGGNQTSVAADSFGAPSVEEWHFVVAWHDSINNTI